MLFSRNRKKMHLKLFCMRQPTKRGMEIQNNDHQTRHIYNTSGCSAALPVMVLIYKCCLWVWDYTYTLTLAVVTTVDFDCRLGRLLRLLYTVQTWLCFVIIVWKLSVVSLGFRATILAMEYQRNNTENRCKYITRTQSLVL